MKKPAPATGQGASSLLYEGTAKAVVCTQYPGRIIRWAAASAQSPDDLFQECGV